MPPSRLIRRARQDAGLTQQQLAERMNTTQSVIARLESPRSNPRMDTLARAVAATGHQIHVDLRPEPQLDETMIVANLRMEPIQRLRAFASAYVSVRDLVGKVRAP